MIDLEVTLLNSEELGENLALFSGSTFMQTKFWADLKAEYGFKPFYFRLFNLELKEATGLLVLLRPLFRGYYFAYIPHGPAIGFSDSESLEVISEKVKKCLPKKTLFIRYDLLIGTVGNDFPVNLKGKLFKSSTSVQVPDTTILDITPIEDVLLGGMHKKTRYNIKLSSKKGVTIREGSYEDIQKWYNLYEVTAKRDSIAIHSLKYYQSVYQKAKFSSGVDMKLLFAEHNGDLLAGIFVLIHGDGATYLYGASSNEKRNLMPAYLLQWEAIKSSKLAGALYYDFFGIPPVNDKNHPMYGLYRFKTGFGGQIVHRHGCYDYSLSLLYPMFRFLEKLRTFYYKRIRR